MNYQSAIRDEYLTLPTVEGGFGTLNIPRDPPKSYYTKYKPKVFDTSLLTEMIDASGDRTCESILKFARGRNPMVSVSYSNDGTNGGQYRFGSGNTSENASLTNTGARQAFLPYRVMREGAFRPPIIPPEQLLPLSRQPRHLTSQYTNKGSDAIRRDDLTKCDSKLNALRTNLLRTYVDGRASIIIETPAQQPTDLDKAITEKRNYYVNTNKGTATKKTSSVSDFVGNQLVKIHDRLQGTLSTNVKGMESNSTVAAKQRVLSRNIPAGSMHTNRVDRTVDINPFVCAQYNNLPDRLQRGGINNGGFQPTSTRQENTVHLKERNLYQRALQLERSR